MRVDLKTAGVPSGWTARFRGGGLTVDGVYVDPKNPPDLTLDVEIPDAATASSNTITITATGGGLTAVLPLSIRVADAAAGNVTLTHRLARPARPRGHHVHVQRDDPQRHGRGDRVHDGRDGTRRAGP